MISIKELFYRLVKSLRGARGLDFSLFVIQKTVISLFTGKIMHGGDMGGNMVAEGAGSYVYADTGEWETDGNDCRQKKEQ